MNTDTRPLAVLSWVFVILAIGITSMFALLKSIDDMLARPTSQVVCVSGELHAIDSRGTTYRVTNRDGRGFKCEAE